VAIMGGTAAGAGQERTRLGKMQELFEKRRTIEEVMSKIVKGTACCATCGLSSKDDCCTGMNSGIFLLEIGANRMAFCSPTKSFQMKLKFAHPADLEDYILGRTLALEEAEDSTPASVIEAPEIAGKQAMVRE
jgi:hypothetical protein